MGLFQWLFRAKDPPLAENPNDSGLVGELIKAAQAGDEKHVEKMLRRGIDPNNCNNAGNTALNEAVLNERPQVVQLLLKSGADPNFASRTGWSPIMCAAWEGADSTPIMRQLLANTPGVARTASHWREVLLLLLAGGADPNWQVEADGNLKGWTPLMTAAQEEYAAVAKELLKAGANPDIRNAQGMSALHIAAQRGNAEIVYLLASAGANPNFQGNDGWTPLMCAAVSGNSVVVQTLLKHKADVSLRDDRGNTAMKIAQNTGHADIALQLLAAGSP
jgi:ankyrin repeat protein